MTINTNINRGEIIVIDKDENSGEYFNKILGNTLFSITYGNSLSFVYDHIKKETSTPSLIIIDGFEDGKITGMDFLSETSRSPLFDEIPVIIMSDSKDTELSSIKKGATDFIKKPLDLSDIQASDIAKEKILRAIRLGLTHSYMSNELILSQQDIMAEHTKSQELIHQMLLSLSSTIDAKDEYTQGHSRRVAVYSTKIGTKLGMTHREIESLYRTAMLHDIGKIGVSDVVLRKNGKLTDAEYDIIKRHSVIGYDILRSITVMPEIANGCLHHHEKYDGSGYPDGLKGKDIPIFSRIIAVADSLDAMTSDRSYRSAMSMHEALDEIKRCKGTQFDPKIADIAIELIENTIAGRKDGF